MTPNEKPAHPARVFCFSVCKLLTLKRAPPELLAQESEISRIAIDGSPGPAYRCASLKTFKWLKGYQPSVCGNGLSTVCVTLRVLSRS